MLTTAHQALSSFAQDGSSTAKTINGWTVAALARIGILIDSSIGNAQQNLRQRWRLLTYNGVPIRRPSMTYMHQQIDRVRHIAAEIQRLEDYLMGNRIIPMPEQTTIHAQIQKLKKERDLLEQRTRQSGLQR